jgi:peptidoglycan-N-acetylglucosamine deacetylase
LSRFLIISLLAVVVFFSIGLFLQGPMRLWVFTAFWTMYLTTVGLGVSFIQFNFFGPVICSGKTDQLKVALTFDDGPDPLATPVLLDLLAREKIAATFFCIGKNVVAYPELAARIVTEGHLIANHTFNHYPWTALLGRRELTKEITETQLAITRATTAVPSFMRPPMGLTNPIFFHVLKHLNLRMVGWHVRSMDTRWPAEKVIARALKKIRPGSIVLLHDGNRSPQQVEQIVTKIAQTLRHRGYTLERLDLLLSSSGAATSIATT